MARSMTAFGRATEIINGREITFELKSVNSKFFDFNIKYPKNYGMFEEKIKSFIGQNGVTRGKVDVYLSVNQIESSDVKITVDTAYAAGYIDACRELRDKFGLKDDITVMSIAKNPLVFTTVTAEVDADALWNDLSSVLKKALDAFVLSREVEGERLAADLLIKREELIELTSKLKARSEVYVPEFRARLEERLNEVLSRYSIKADEALILNECAIYADKTAIDEELVRLSTHLASFKEILSSNEPVGRRLDFLMQEINREINTSGSKCSDSESAAIVVDMKCIAEKIREQIQNLE